MAVPTEVKKVATRAAWKVVRKVARVEVMWVEMEKGRV